MKRELPVADDVFEFAYPFVRDTYTEHHADEDGYVEAKVPTWKPGVRMEMIPPDDCQGVADGVGAQILTVVDVFKPGKFPTRVFFTRKWRDPDGKEFGKGGCRVLGICGWRNLLNGYRHEYYLNGKCLNSPWDRIGRAFAELGESR
jgi:hypothetical protein